MGDIQEFRPRENVRAEKVDESGWIFTSRGRAWANEGDYLVYENGETYHSDAESFDGFYELVPESVGEAKRYTPDGKTVPEVLEFFRENPSEIDRVKGLEAKSGNRKGILEYEV